MDLESNPFYLLGASIRDGHHRIVELAEERSLSGDPNQYSKARAILTNPRQRLYAEVAWLPGVAPSRAEDFIKQIRSGGTISARGLVRVSPMASCNLLAWAIIALLIDREPEETLRQCMQALIAQFEDINLKYLLQLINEDRSAAGFTLIQSEDAVQEALATHRSFLGKALREGLDKFREPDVVLTEIASYITVNGSRQAPLLLEELTALYQIEVQQHLNRLSGQILKFTASIKKLLAAAKGQAEGLSDCLEQLASSVREWDRIAQPIHLISKTRGIEDEGSVELASGIRDFTVCLANEFGLHKEAQALSKVMAEVFAELPQLSSRVDDDLSTLQDIVVNKEKATTEELEKWEKEIFLDLYIGFNQLIISAEKISYNGVSIRTNEVDWVRWGKPPFLISLGSQKDMIVIECKRFMENRGTVERYETILSKLWKAVCVRLVTKTLSRLSAGEELTIGNAIVNMTGVVLHTPKHWLKSEPVLCPWEDIAVSSESGDVRIYCRDDPSTCVKLSYSDANVRIVERIARFLREDDDNSARLRKGEFTNIGGS
jgi:hypothetical protein